MRILAMFRSERCQNNNTLLEIQETKLVGGDLTEEKRHAAPITRVVEFGQ
jgi:hypothetical protein